MNRPVYLCPECNFVSTRRWNAQKHMDRLHPHSKKKPKPRYQAELYREQILNNTGNISRSKPKFCWQCGAKL